MKAKYVFSLLSLSMLFAQFPSITSGENVAEWLKNAQTELRQRNDDAAKELFTKILDAPDAETSAKLSAHMGVATILLRTRPAQINHAIEEYEKALALPNLTANDRNNILASSAGAYARASDYDKAIRRYSEIVEDPEANNLNKINALHQISQIHLQHIRSADVESDLENAKESIKKAVELPDLTTSQRLLALTRMGALFIQTADFSEAREIYGKMLKIDDSETNRNAVDKLMTSAWIAEGKYEEAIKINRGDDRILELADVYQRQGNVEAAQRKLRKFLSDPDQDDRVKARVFSQLLSMSIQPARVIADSQIINYDQAKQDAETFLPEMMEADMNRAALLLPLLKDAMQKRRYDIAAWAAPIVMRAENLRAQDYMPCRIYLVNSLAALGKTEDAIQAAEQAANDENITPAGQYRFKVTAAILNPSSMSGDLKKAINTIPAKELSAEDKADAMLGAARTAMIIGDHDTARELHQLYEAMLIKDPTAFYECEFMDKAPSDVGSWLVSPLLENPKKRANLDQKYGSNLKFLLETDAISAERSVSADENDDKDIKTDMYITCDADGIHFLFLAEDSKVKEVIAGFTRGGSYEGYLAPGANQPYYCFIIRLPSGDLYDSFHSMYPHRHFRQALKEHNTVKSSTQPVDNGFATYLFYSWNLFYDKLPENGDMWQFDNIRWTRSGGYSWGGSQSVHNRSSWGNIVFSGLTEKNLRSIKRKIVFDAFAEYKQERVATSLGAIDFWQDVELGDPEFYTSTLKPVVDKLDEYGKKVAMDMSDADVDLLFEKAVPDWMEFKYKAAELRRLYLEDSWFQAEKP